MKNKNDKEKSNDRLKIKLLKDLIKYRSQVQDFILYFKYINKLKIKEAIQSMSN